VSTRQVDLSTRTLFRASAAVRQTDRMTLDARLQVRAEPS